MPEEVTLSIELLLAGVLLVMNLIVLGPVGYILRQHIADYQKHKELMFRKLDEMDDDHQQLLRELPDKYVPIKRYLEEMDQIRQMLQRILDKLDDKADKT